MKMKIIAWGLIAACSIGLVQNVDAWSFTQKQVGYQEKISQGQSGVNMCVEHYPKGMPQTKDEKVNRRIFYFCEENYASGFDPATKTPLWISEVLNGAKLADAEDDGVERENDFRQHPRAPSAIQANNSDYVRSKFDRGHMGAAKNMLTQNAMSESFYFINMVPQVGPNMNRGIWKDLESAARKWAKSRGEILVVSGPIFEKGFEASPKLGSSKVSVPSHLYKVFFDPRTNESLAFIMPNRQIITRKVKTVDQGNPQFPQTQDTAKVLCGGQACTFDDFIVPAAEVEAKTGLIFYNKASISKNSKSRMWFAK